MVKSKFSFLSVYFALAIICLFIFMAISGLLMLGFQQSSSLLIFGVGAVFAGYFLIKQMITVKVSPDRIDLRGLLFKQTIFRDDIRSIDLGSRERVGYLSFKWSTNAVVIKWGRSDEIVLADSFYRNMPQLKRALYENFVSSSGSAPTVTEYVSGEEPLPEGAEENMVTIAGQPLLNVHTLLFLVYIIMIAIALRPIRKDEGGAIYGVILAVVYIPVYIAVGFRLYYIKVSDQHLMIRNHFFPWYVRSFRLKDVSDIVLESSLRRGAGFRINARGFFSRRWSCGSLRRSDWPVLQKTLEEKGVTVKNELPG
ncbi:MAG TPA: hypothetical protein VHD83_17685 [Puia sp.]|nr:hypothetical protein [Puia sp.]